MNDVAEEEKQHRLWILDPAGHRQYERENVPEMMEFFGQQVPVINAVESVGTEWICDYCSGDIRLVNDDGSPQWVPVYRGYALCDNCIQKELDAEDRATYLATKSPAFWSMSVCGCPPCTAELARMTATLPGESVRNP